MLKFNFSRLIGSLFLILLISSICTAGCARITTQSPVILTPPQGNTPIISTTTPPITLTPTQGITPIISTPTLMETGTITIPDLQLTATVNNKDGWGNYVNPTAGIFIEFPDSWNAVPPSNMPDSPISILRNYSLITNDEANIDEPAYNEGQIKIEVGLHPQRIGSDITLTEWASKYYWGDNYGDEIIKCGDCKIETITSNTKFGNYPWLIKLFRFEDKVIIFMAGPATSESLKLINEIAGTLRFGGN